MSDPLNALLHAIKHGDPVAGAQVALVCPAGVMGALEQMPLTEILQSMDFGKKTARVEVHFDEATHGVVHVLDGQIVRADAVTPKGEWTGELAFVELCRRRVGFFRIDFERHDIERNVQRPTTFVLLEALRVLDEAQAERGGGPGFDEPWGEEPAPAPDSAGVEDVGAIDIEVEAEPAVQQHPRFRVNAQVELDLSNGAPSRSALLEDIGQGGAFVATDAEVARGAHVWLRVTTPAGFLDLLGVVVHVLEARAATSVNRSAGIGVSFASLPPEDARDLKVYVDGLAASRARANLGGADDRERLLNCIAESEFLVAAGDLANAQRVLKQAHGLAPDDDTVRRRLMKVNEAIDAAQANALLERALKGAPQAVDLARRATQLRPTRDVLLRSLGVFARAGAHDEIADVADQLLELDPNDEGALRTLLDANRSMERWSVAIQAAEALVRLHPQDAELKAQLTKLVQLARRPM